MILQGGSIVKYPGVFYTAGMRTHLWNAQSATSLYVLAAAAYAQLRSVVIVSAMAR